MRLPCCRYNARTMALTAERLQESVAVYDRGGIAELPPDGRGRSQEVSDVRRTR